MEQGKRVKALENEIRLIEALLPDAARLRLERARSNGGELWINGAEASRLAKVGRQTIYDWIASGTLKRRKRVGLREMVLASEVLYAVARHDA